MLIQTFPKGIRAAIKHLSEFEWVVDNRYATSASHGY